MTRRLAVVLLIAALALIVAELLLMAFTSWSHVGNWLVVLGQVCLVGSCVAVIRGSRVRAKARG